MINWTNDTVALGDLKPWGHNPRRSTKKQARALLDSMAEFGQVQTIAIGPEGEVYDGHQRLSALLTVHGKGYEVDARRSDRALTDDERRRLVVKLHAGAMGEWDFEELGNWDMSLLVENGFDQDALDATRQEMAFLIEMLGEGDEEAQAGEEGDGKEVARATLAERFIVPPFSVLDARQGYWQDRKRAWIGLGLQGELGRGGNIGAVAPNENGNNGILSRTGKYSSQKDNNGLLGISKQARSHYKKEIATSNSSQSRLTALQKTENSKASAKVFGTEGNASEQTGTSIFDPVLSELLYRWFMPKGGHVLNPMSGEATHGIVAGYLGYKFTGVELRPEQAESNREQAQKIGVDPVWITADALTIDVLDIAPADFVVSCPPYADLEVYSDNPLDISTMEYKDFIAVYSEIIKKSCAVLKDDRFAAFVVGEVRDSKGIYYDFVGDTIKAFKAAGLKYYNEMILVTSVGSLPIRVGRQFDAGRKIGKTHQNVLVFVKGDPKKASIACGAIDMEVPDGFGTNS